MWIRVVGFVEARCFVRCQRRWGHRMRGLPPTEARTIRQRLDELNAVDPFYKQKINIGLPVLRPSRSLELTERLQHLKESRKNIELEKQARNHELKVDLNDVNAEWLKYNGPHHIKKIAEHYSVYEHLYNEGYFVPRVPLKILYDVGNGLCSPVYYGNIVKPSEAKAAPSVTYEAEKNTLWTLILTNLDGNLTDSNKEYLHWCVSNITGNDVENGETIVDYLRPIPPKGTGYHRYVFVLYKQEERVNYDIKKVVGDSSLADRTFVTREWYKKYQDAITPAGLAFFQTDWDSTLTSFYHKTLNMKEPIYEYDFPKPYIRPQVWFPKKQPFNLYMDKYRDPKQISKEYFLRKLKTEHPFLKPEPPLKYPNAIPFPKSMPSWLKFHEKKIRLNIGRVNDV